MSISLAQGVQLAMTAERRLGSVQGNVLQSELNLELAASDFDWFIIPKVDAGMIGGGRAGVGATFGMGAEFNKKFASGTRISIIPSMMKAAKDYQSNLRMSVTQPLLRGCGKTFTLAPLKAAQYANRSALRQLYLAQTNQVFQAIRGLYEIARQQAIVGLDKESFERMEKFVVSTKIKEKIGMCDSLDIYRAQTEFKLTEDSLSHSLERLQDAKDNLRDILGIPLDIPIKAEVVVEYDPIEIDQSEAITTALRNRIEISQAEDQYQETRRLEHLAGSNLRPEINLVIDYTSFSWDEAFTRSWSNKRESKWGIGFISSGDPWNTREQAAYDMSRFASVDAGRNVEQVRDNVILEVKRAIRDIKRAHEKINLSEEQIENSKKGYYLARLKFEYGMANNFDLLQAEKSLRQSQIALVNAIVDHRIGEFRLLGSLGMLIEKPMVCQ
jgi:outer membrane protein TolC